MDSAIHHQHSGTYERTRLLPTKSFKPATRQTAEKPVRLLIVSDEPQRANTWRKALLGQACEVTEQTLKLTGSSFLPRNFDLVVVDVTATRLIQVLATIRATERQIPVLVDASRLPTDLSCVGVLPQFRAMACTRPDLLRLVNQYCKPADRPTPIRQLL
jgi:hypothetical protein